MEMQDEVAKREEEAKGISIEKEKMEEMWKENVTKMNAEKDETMEIERGNLEKVKEEKKSIEEKAN